MGLTLETTVEGFFHEIVVESLAHQGLKATPPAEYYLVGLLGEFTKARITDEPLSLLYLEAQQGISADSVRALKEVGDTSLYVTGFFGDSLEQKMMSVNFYESLGQAAYGSLAGRLSTSGAAEVYRELSQKFHKFVEVLARVRSKVNVASDVVNLCRRWMAKPDAALEEQLRAFGVVIAGGDKRFVQ